jgi:FkbM family methyltransferase
MKDPKKRIGIYKGENFSKGNNANRENEVKYSMKDILKKGDVVYDVGAHIGELSIYCSKIVGSKGKIFSFEPNKFIVNYLKDSIKKSKVKNVNVIEKAVTNIDKKKLKFFVDLDPGSWGSSLGNHQFSINKDYIRECKKTSVESITLDSFFYNNRKQTSDYYHKSPKLIKIDVEEFEVNVLQGAIKLIKEYKPYIIFEYRHLYQEFEKDPIILLKKLGYKFYDCSLYQRVEKFSFIQKNLRADLWQNILAVHKESYDLWSNLYVYPYKISLSNENFYTSFHNKKYKIISRSYLSSIFSFFSKKSRKKESYLSLKKTVLNGNDNFKIVMEKINYAKISKKDIDNYFIFQIKKKDFPYSYLNRYRICLKLSTGYPYEKIDVAIRDFNNKLLSVTYSPAYYYRYSNCYQNIIFDTNGNNEGIRLYFRSENKRVRISKIIIYSILKMKSW